MSKKKKKYTLVISGGGTRGFYALGILKGLEELGYKERIQAMYGVSAGAILVSYRAAGYTAEQIFTTFFNARPFGLLSLNIISKKSLLKTKYFEEQFKKDLPKNMSSLSHKVYIGATDATTGKYISFESGDLPKILLGSMSIPGIFPTVSYKNYCLMDGGATNNFPVTLAKKKYPNNEIIGIALNKFKENQKIETMLDALSVSFEILLRYNTVKDLPLVEHLFYRDLPLKVLDISKKNMRKAYLEGYNDCIEHFNSKK